MRSEELIMNITGPKAEPWTTLELISSDWERRVEFCAMGSVLKKIKKPPKDVIRDGEGSEL